MRLRPFLFLLALIVLPLAGCRTPVVMTHGIPNFAVVEPGVYRGGQPTSEGWAWLKSQGVIFDLKLNTEAEASDALARTNGLDVIKLPITLAEQTIGKPKHFITLATGSCISAGREQLPRGGIFVHCEHGQDRTGLIIGAYRVEFEHWTKAAAYQEMLEHGFHPALNGLYQAWLYDVPLSGSNNFIPQTSTPTK